MLDLLSLEPIMRSEIVLSFIQGFVLVRVESSENRTNVLPVMFSGTSISGHHSLSNIDSLQDLTREKSWIYAVLDIVERHEMDFRLCHFPILMAQIKLGLNDISRTMTAGCMH